MLLVKDYGNIWNESDWHKPDINSSNYILTKFIFSKFNM